jgi:glycosyltransferase involved in cell wall biosynthesis
MKVGIHNPYLDTLGGGERYTLTFAKVLSDSGWEVDLEWKDIGIKKLLEDRFGIDLKNINMVDDIKRGNGYDLCFWVTDGSIPTLYSRKNFLHFQVPFHGLGSNDLLNKMKLFRINEIICNSVFTKNVIDKEYGVESKVIYPPVPTEKIIPKRKENIILSVARFSNLKQSKRQDILVTAFKRMIDDGLKNWKLILAGGVEVGDGGETDYLTKLSDGYPIEIIKSPDFKGLLSIYGKAKIFWSASGFEENEEKNPEKVEHFGISVVEAMASGSVPIVYKAGGYKEIITRENGFLWSSISELIKITNWNINNPPEMRNIARNSKKDSELYSESRFREQILKII